MCKKKARLSAMTKPTLPLPSRNGPLALLSGKHPRLHLPENALSSPVKDGVQNRRPGRAPSKLLLGFKSIMTKQGSGLDKVQPSESLKDDILFTVMESGEGVSVALEAISLVLSYSVIVLNVLNSNRKKKKKK